MANQGMALMGTGYATGENRAVEAATNAISSPLLENISIDGAKGIIINVTGGPNLSLYEVNEASTLITEAADEDAEIIFGAVIDERLTDEVRVTVIATGFTNSAYDRTDKQMNQIKAMAEAQNLLRQQMATGRTSYHYQAADVRPEPLIEELEMPKSFETVRTEQPIKMEQSVEVVKVDGPKFEVPLAKEAAVPTAEISKEYPEYQPTSKEDDGLTAKRAFACKGKSL